MSGRLVNVALPLPFQAPFTYRLPEGEAEVERGARVLVPFGSRRVIGVVTGAATERAGKALKDVVQVVDESPLVPPPLLDLAAWVAEHYLAPPGECYRLVMPPAGVRASRAVVRLPPYLWRHAGAAGHRALPRRPQPPHPRAAARRTARRGLESPSAAGCRDGTCST